MEISFRSGAADVMWKDGLLPVYLFFGEEDRLKDEAVEALRKRVIDPDFEDFDCERLNGASVSADAILSAAGQVSYGSERRLVIVKGMEQWRDRVRQADVERLADGLSRASSGCCIALVVAAEEEDARRKTAVSPRLDNAVKKLGALVACKALQGENLAAWLRSRAKREGKEIDDTASEQLIGAVGSELLVLEQEILKLACYVGDRDAITARDVSTVTASSPEDVMFVTVDAILRRQPDRALQLLAQLHRYDPKPQSVAGRLLSLLARQLRMLWQAKYLAEERIAPRDVRSLPPNIAEELPTESNIAQLAFKAGDLFAQARGYTWTELRRAHEQLLMCDLANKGGVTDEMGVFSSDPKTNLQLLVLELAQREASAPAREGSWR